MRKIYLLTVLFSLVAFFGFGQSGEISGKVVDENNEGIPFANVAIVENGQATGTGATTDFDGFYSIKPLNPGKYDVKFSYLGYTSVIETGVVVRNDQTTYVDRSMSTSEQIIEEVVIIEYKVPLIDPGETSSKKTISSEDIADLPSRNIANIASTAAGVTENANGEISVRGGRGDAVVYYVDGIRVSGNVNLPVSAVEQIDVITGGVPSRYGDATAGVINITTKGGARKFAGGVEFQSSLDQWRFDLVNVNLAGPMIKNEENQTIIGYAVNAEFQRQLDPRPSSVDMYKLNDGLLEELQAEPLYLDEEGIVRVKAENLTFDDLQVNNIKRNTTDLQGRFNGRLDFRLNDAMTIAVGANASYQKNHRWIEEYSLLNYENNPLYVTQNYKGFARFTHNFKKSYELEDGAKKSAFQNGFYQVQVDYEKFKRVYSDDSHGDDFFAYGYIGEYAVAVAPNFVEVSSDDDSQIFSEFTGFSDTAVYFTPSATNQQGSNYTSQYLDLAGSTSADGTQYFSGSVIDLQATPALINGERAEIPHGLWYNTGRQYNGYGVDNDNDKFRGQINGGFDILKPGSESRNKHSITFGVEFEQRVLRNFNVSPLGLWDVARQNTNTHLVLDRDNPYLYNGGDLELIDPDNADIYAGDSIFFFETADYANQSTFDRNLREKIGADDNERINVYELPLETFSIDMFSADELLENNTVSSYRGYDIYGNRISEKISFSDFWNKVDENGEKTRPIAPFMPTYSAGYVEDKFQLKDLTFRIGFRVDRYDANQKVLKDPYAVLGSITVADLPAGSEVPANIKEDYVPYAAPGSDVVLAYRDGNQFYNVEGVEVANFEQLGVGLVQPIVPEAHEGLTTPEDNGYDTDVAFEDYKAAYTIMPRLQFSFNITDNALFFAHYDVLSQTPQSRIDGNGFFQNRSIGNPFDYYNFSEVGGTPIANPNLRPETTIDFQLGFKQKLTASSAITFSAYFKEYKNQIQVKRFDGVSGNGPKRYYTYDNIDFGNTKGFEFGYDLRRTNNIRLNANYTLQFAEGTGSDDRTQLQVVTNTGTNFRTVSPLDFDSRHILNLSADYRFGEGKEYNGPKTKKGKQILSNFGVNLLAQARSGTPYTRQENVVSERIIGAATRATTLGYINGSRIGWNFTLDLKVSKSFSVQLAKNNEERDGKKLYFDVYLWVDNIIGTANVTDVYRFTGQPGDDGFIDSQSGEVATNSAINSESYRDLYKASVNTPTNYGLPRRVYLGGSINF